MVSAGAGAAAIAADPPPAAEHIHLLLMRWFADYASHILNQRDCCLAEDDHDGWLVTEKQVRAIFGGTRCTGLHCWLDGFEHTCPLHGYNIEDVDNNPPVEEDLPDEDLPDEEENIGADFCKDRNCAIIIRLAAALGLVQNYCFCKRGHDDEEEEDGEPTTMIETDACRRTASAPTMTSATTLTTIDTCLLRTTTTRRAKITMPSSSTSKRGRE
jgi:hypothetical protein